MDRRGVCWFAFGLGVALAAAVIGAVVAGMARRIGAPLDEIAGPDTDGETSEVPDEQRSLAAATR